MPEGHLRGRDARIPRLLSVRVCPKGIAAAARRMHRIGGRKAGAVRVCPKGIAAAARRMHRIGGRKKAKKEAALMGCL